MEIDMMGQRHRMAVGFKGTAGFEDELVGAAVGWVGGIVKQQDAHTVWIGPGRLRSAHNGGD